MGQQGSNTTFRVGGTARQAGGNWTGRFENPEGLNAWHSMYGSRLEPGDTVTVGDAILKWNGSAYKVIDGDFVDGPTANAWAANFSPELASGSTATVNGQQVMWGGAGWVDDYWGDVAESFPQSGASTGIADKTAECTITNGVGNADSAITGGVNVGFTGDAGAIDPRFVPYNANLMVRIAILSGGYYYRENTNRTCFFSFIGDSKVFELDLFQDCTLSIFADDGTGMAFYGKTVTQAVGGESKSYKQLVTFTTRKLRKIVIYGKANAIRGVTIGKLDSFVGIPSEFSAACIADSFGEQISEHGSRGFWGELSALSICNGSQIAFCDSNLSGSGYGVGTTTFAQRLANIKATNPKVVFVFGGINDPELNLESISESVLQTLRQDNPQAILVVGSAWNPNSTTSGNTPNKDASIFAALSDIAGPWVFVDSTQGRWETSNGKSGKIGGGKWLTGFGRELDFTAPLVAATSGTLTQTFAGTTGTYTIAFSSGDERTATLTLGSSAVSWTGAVTASAKVGAYTVAGNTAVYILRDGVHPDALGCAFLAASLYTATAAGIGALGLA